MYNALRKDKYIFEPREMRLFKDVKDNEFKPLVDKLLSIKKGFNIDGPAGTGKSTLIKTLQQQMDENKKNALMVSIIVNGITLHSFASKLKKETKHTKYEL